MEELKFTLKSLSWLKEKQGIDLFKGAEISLDEPETVAALFVAGLQHKTRPPTIKEVMEKRDALEVFASVSESPILKGQVPGKKAAAPKKRAAKKRTR